MLKLNIYIVEDNLLIASALKHMVVRLGHCVCGTSVTYKKAVKDLQNMDIDLVITDIMLTGEKNGVDLGRFIKAQLQIPFIFQSSVIESEMIKDALATSPHAYLSKPVSMDTLSKAISTMIRYDYK